jgi:hypothetical protein
MIAVLFAEKHGCYFGIPGIELWDVEKDARQYGGPHPVICHPPCHLWTRFARINFARWGGEHNRPGNDNNCFLAAFAAVLRFGGVLEHPAFSYAWDAFAIGRPTQAGGWQQGNFGPNTWACEVWQSAYGHPARKRTWLLYSGSARPIDLNWERPDGTHQIGYHDQRGKDRNKPTISGKRASATPPRFRDALIQLVEGASRNVTAI